MAILLDKQSRVCIQGITGAEGSFHTRESVKLGTRVVAGVTPGKGGTDLDGIPVYDRVIDAVEKHGANVSGIYTPPAFAPDAILEAIEAGIGLIVCMTEGIPVLEMIKVKQALKGSGSRLIGPNCPGIATPGVGKVGFMPNFIHPGGERGRRVAERDPHLRDDLAVDGTRDRPVHLRRDRRGPDHRFRVSSISSNSSRRTRRPRRS